ncbi:MAG: N-acetylgalactosamine 6-sulfate sulfatase (GALNS), partial [Lentisphaerae bacterium]
MSRKLTQTLMTGATLFSLSGIEFSAAAVNRENRPNIVFIFADDWGWGDLSCHGHPWLKTPNIDRLAREGTDFQRFHVLSPVCSPSRVAVMTGMFPARFCIHGHFASLAQNMSRGMPDWLDPRAPTLPRFLKKAGYKTGHFGKWHLCSSKAPDAPMPQAYGIDVFKGFNGSAAWKGTKADSHATASNAVKFIRENKDHPFFVNVWLQQTHTPHIPTPASMEKWKHLDKRKQVYSAVVTDGDNAVGMILDTLDQEGLTQHTIVIFSSDNGPESASAKAPSQRQRGKYIAYNNYYSIGSTGGMRGRKRNLFEGGIRLPFIVRWPGHTPTDVVNEETEICAVDLLPTLCAAAGVTLPADYRGDGENMLPALEGKKIQRKRPLFW